MLPVMSQHEDSPEVASMRKRIRGEALTPAEEAILARSSRKPPEGEGRAVPHAEIERKLEERKHRG